MRINHHVQLVGSGLPRSLTTIHPSSLPKHRGRPRKPEGAQTATQRKQAQRQREKLEQEAFERQSKFNALMVELSKRDADKDQIFAAIAAVISSEPNHEKKDQQWKDLSEAVKKEHNDRRGRFAEEDSKAPADIERIFHGKSRSGQVVTDSLGQVLGYDLIEDKNGAFQSLDRGRRVRPEGYGSYTNQEGFSNSEWLFEAGRSRRANLGEGQESNPTRYGWRYVDKDALGDERLQIFAEENFDQISVCPLPRIRIEDEDDYDGMQTALCCGQLMSSKTRKALHAPKGTRCDYVTDEMTATDSGEVCDEQWRQAKQHILECHKRDFREGIREKQKPNFDGKCSPEDHEQWRKKAVERHDKAVEDLDRIVGQYAGPVPACEETEKLKSLIKEAVACPHCGATIYLPPPGPRYAPDSSIEKQQAERETKREQGQWRQLKADRYGGEAPRKLPLDLALKVLSQQGTPDLGN